MTDRAEIERLLKQTGRTLEGVTKVEIGYGSRRNGKTMSIIKHQSDVIELLVGALRDALDKPMQKPLTLEELHNLIDPGDEVVAWCEVPEFDSVHPNLWYRGMVQGPDPDCHAIRTNCLNWDGYGKTCGALGIQTNRRRTGGGKVGELINGRTPEEIKERAATCITSTCSECPYDRTEYFCDATDVMNNLLAYAQHLEAQQPKWISVKDRLPEAEGMYIVYIPLTGETMIAADYLDGHWIDWEVDLTEHVTHWMPLPEPPKEDNHENA